jgi:hypothetical protein
VYCSSAQGEGRRTQFDYWAHTDLADLEKLGGRPALLVGAPLRHWLPAFADVQEQGQLRGETKRDRVIYIGIDYHGFAREETLR